jgi:uncharacterized protein with NRDE domain
MCLIVLAWRVRPDFPLVVAANRDEFHVRAAAPAEFWPDEPRILAGRDLEAKGTWMGVSRDGRFAAVTNYRGGREPRAIESRGALVTRFLVNGTLSREYVLLVHGNGARYSGFNLLVCDGEELWWCSNRDRAPRRLAPGIYGLGNLLLDSDDVTQSKQRFARAIESSLAAETLFEVVAPARITAPEYGTRCSSALLLGNDGTACFAERAFDPAGVEGETLRYEFALR